MRLTADLLLVILCWIMWLSQWQYVCLYVNYWIFYVIVDYHHRTMAFSYLKSTAICDHRLVLINICIMLVYKINTMLSQLTW